jgi:hypothetical protein
VRVVSWLKLALITMGLARPAAAQDYMIGSRLSAIESRLDALDGYGGLQSQVSRLKRRVDDIDDIERRIDALDGGSLRVSSIQSDLEELQSTISDLKRRVDGLEINSILSSRTAPVSVRPIRERTLSPDEFERAQTLYCQKHVCRKGVKPTYRMMHRDTPFWRERVADSMSTAP